MTDDELRLLIAECEAGRPLVRPHDLLELARDALRFRHAINRAYHMKDADIRSAIDADMEASR